MTALSVNLNKVATVRNTRALDIPSVARAATICLQSGAQGITVHPRPDGRHIRDSDVREISAVLKDFKDAEFNIEGNPFHNLMHYVQKYKPDQVTFVPDSEGQLTSDHGWDLPRDCERLRPVVQAAQEMGVRVSLFMDASPESMHFAGELGVQRVELYTEPYARAFSGLLSANKISDHLHSVLEQFRISAQRAVECGLQLNAGHDLNLHNLPLLLKTIPSIGEVSIGHAFIADALELGYAGAVSAYLQTISAAFGGKI